MFHHPWGASGHDPKMLRVGGPECIDRDWSRDQELRLGLGLGLEVYGLGLGYDFPLLVMVSHSSSGQSVTDPGVTRVPHTYHFSLKVFFIV